MDNSIKRFVLQKGDEKMSIFKQVIVFKRTLISINTFIIILQNKPFYTIIHHI